MVWFDVLNGFDEKKHRVQCFSKVFVIFVGILWYFSRVFYGFAFHGAF